MDVTVQDCSIQLLMQEDAHEMRQEMGVDKFQVLHLSDYQHTRESSSVLNDWKPHLQISLDLQSSLEVE